MQREIKFRGISSDSGKWIYGSYHKPFEDVEQIIESIKSNASQMSSVVFGTCGQFTGLKDKKGKEIYEGDIVSSGIGEIIWCNLECMFKVRWNCKIFKSIRGQNDKYTLNGEPLFVNANIVWEVVGNIYENPELIK